MNRLGGGHRQLCSKLDSDDSPTAASQKLIQSSLHHTVYNIHSALLQILSHPKHTEALSSLKRFSSGCCVSPAKDKISQRPCEVLIMYLPAMTWQKRGWEPSAPSQLVARFSFGEGVSSIMLIKPCGSWNLCVLEPGQYTAVSRHVFKSHLSAVQSPMQTK